MAHLLRQGGAAPDPQRPVPSGQWGSRRLAVLWFRAFGGFRVQGLGVLVSGILGVQGLGLLGALGFRV